MSTIRENDFIEQLTRHFKRSPLQKNRLQESDCELIGLPGTEIKLALTTDSIVEEIERGLYADPYQIGWMTVIINLSDLSAVGAEPVGILLNETLPPETDPDFLDKLQAGIQDACSANGIYVLGGDTNFSSSMQMNGCAVGIIRDDRLLTRCGCRPGDHLFASGKLGLGNSYALVRMSVMEGNLVEPLLFRPGARIKEGQVVRRFASCCIDTSDGLIPALDQLMRLNDHGFVIQEEIGQLLDPLTSKVAAARQIPAWMMLAGPHGEFELIFTVPPEKVTGFLESASFIGWEPLCLGLVQEEKSIEFFYRGNQISVDTARIRNLFDEVKGDVRKYIQELFKLDYLWKPEDRP